jgi:4-amino-4-deoxy-L-arabinose transferase-like glycosyltransferase
MRNWLLPAALGVLAITALRVVLLVFNRTDLFVDEAQYWLWGQDLAFGYYSKPPLIGWVIRAFTEIGSDAPFWVRLPAPLFHGATAMILGSIAAHLFSPRAGIVTALGYVTLPMVAVGSLLISTDTIMFPFLAASLAAYLRLLDQPDPRRALFCGLMLGLALMAKYAAVYYLLMAALAALALPGARPNRKSVALILLAFAVTISPNIGWNIVNGFTTVQHTLDNADWVRDPGTRAALNFAGLWNFFASQFAVFGPVLFASLLILGVTWRHQRAQTRLLLIFSLPIIAIVCIQALLSQAYANWAASAYLAGSLAVLPWLLNRHRIWLILSFAINGALGLIFPLATTVADSLYLGQSQPVLQRYIGRTDMSRAILKAARDNGLTTIVASDRDVLADLFYTARNEDIRIFALPTKGRAPHHYALKFPYQPADENVLYVTRATEQSPCPDTARTLSPIAPTTGAYRKHPQLLYVVAGTCFSVD